MRPAETVAQRYARESVQARKRADIDWRSAPSTYPDPTPPSITLPWRPTPASHGQGDLPTLSLLLRDAYGPHRLTWSAPGGWGVLLAQEGRSAPAGVPGHLKRPVPSGGARYPCDLYILAERVAGLPAGTYRYHPGHHQLHATGPRTVLRPPAAGHLTIAVVAVMARNTVKYGDFGYRLHSMDTGVVVGQLLLAAARHGYSTDVSFYAPDDALDHDLGLPRACSSVYALIDVTPRSPGTATVTRSSAARRGSGDGPPDWETGLPAALHAVAARETRPPRRPAPALSTELPAVQGWTDLPPPRRATGPATPRRSCLGYFSGRPITRAQLSNVLAAGQADYGNDLTFPAFAHTVVHLVVNLVDGIEPGVYRYDPDGHRIGLIRSGDLRRELHLALVSRIFDSPRSAVCLFPVTEYPRRIAALGPRWFRIQSMQAGIVTQRSYAAAASENLACHAHCGYDAARVNGLLGLDGTTAAAQIEVMLGGRRESGTHYEHLLTDH